jgi:transketolase
MTLEKQLSILAMENRERIIRMIYYAKAGHPGGSLSIIDILTAIYELDVDLASKKRSRVILSKGHAVPAQYAVFNEKGILSDEEMKTYRTVNSRLQGHPYLVDIPQSDATTGLLGQGLSIAVGVAVAKKHDGENNRVYAIVGDGEMMEGQIWEAILEAPQFRLDNLVLIVDYNKLSSSGPVKDEMDLDPLAEKLKAFRWDVLEIDGHNMEQIVKCIRLAQKGTGKPIAIIANTVKGKGVSFMENNPKWHSSALTDEEYHTALADIRRGKEAICLGK